MLGSLFIGQTVEAIGQALLSAGANDGLIAVIGPPRVAHALQEQGFRVLVVASKPKSLRRAKGIRVYSDLAALPLESGGLAGLVAFDASQHQAWATRLAAWSDAVRARGTIVLVDRASPADMTRIALCGGLMEIQQRQTGRTFITSGRVEKLPAALPAASRS